MPETPQRDLEKQLRQHAEQRRAAAGEPSLHPATRRLLQSEVRRHWGGRNAGPAKGGWLPRFWPRLAFALGVVAVLGTAAVFMFGPGKKAPMNFAKLEENAPTASAMPVAAPATTPGVADSALTALEREDSGRLPADSTVSSGARFADRMGGFAAAPAAPPAAQDFSATETLAAKNMAPVTESQFFGGAALAKRVDSKENDGRAEGITAASSASAMDAAGGNLQSLAVSQADKQALGVTQYFRNVAIPEGEKTKGTDALPVLGNFTVAQNGNELTVVDEDGSVYNGTAELAPPVIVSGRTVSSDAGLAGARPATRLAAKDEVSRRSATKAVPAESNTLTVGMEASPAQAIAAGEPVNWQFKVEGTNRSLQQRVVFTGNLIQNTFNNPAENRSQQVYQQVPAAQNQLRNYNQGQLAPQNNFINGRVVLDNRKETELNALSVEPK
jgi:hypothetical protein